MAEIWLITKEEKGITATNGAISIRRSSYTKLWHSLIIYFFQWLKSDEPEFIIRKGRE